MQTTIYFGDEDGYLLDLVDKMARRERKSRSAIILSLIEQYFERDSRLGEILVDMGLASGQEVERALEEQRQGTEWMPLGQILVQKGIVTEDQVERALVVQARSRGMDTRRRN